jgi:hypothetical protein
MENKTQVETIIGFLERRKDLDTLIVEQGKTPALTISSEIEIDESIVRFYNEIPSLKIKWFLDFLETTIPTLDTGIDLVAGFCNIISIDRMIDNANSTPLIQTRFFAHHEILNREKANFFVFDNGSPDYLAFFKKEGNKIKDRIFLSYSTYPEQIFDLGLNIDEYISLGAQAAFFADWQLALLKIKKRSTQNILHYLPALFPELEKEGFMKLLNSNGLTDESFVKR